MNDPLMIQPHISCGLLPVQPARRLIGRILKNKPAASRGRFVF